LGKTPENLSKTSENLGKISKNPGKNGAQGCLTSGNDVQRLQKNTIKIFLGDAPKTDLHVLCGKNLWAKVAQKRFGQVWGNSGRNSSHPKKVSCSYTYALS